MIYVEIYYNPDRVENHSRKSKFATKLHRKSKNAPNGSEYLTDYRRIFNTDDDLDITTALFAGFSSSRGREYKQAKVMSWKVQVHDYWQYSLVALALTMVLFSNQRKKNAVRKFCVNQLCTVMYCAAIKDIWRSGNTLINTG